VDDGGPGTTREVVAERFAIVTVGAADAHFDQLVRRQGAVHFGEQFSGEAGDPDLDDGVERVCSRFQVCALARRQRRRHRVILFLMALEFTPRDGDDATPEVVHLTVLPVLNCSCCGSRAGVAPSRL
jgi:hypothetical protein